MTKTLLLVEKPYLQNNIAPNGDISRNNPSFFDKNWANERLHLSIEFLKEGASSEGSWLWNQRLAAVLIFKKELLERGFEWQAARVDNWIHRLQPRKIRIQEGQDPLAPGPGNLQAEGLTSEREGGSF